MPDDITDLTMQIELETDDEPDKAWIDRMTRMLMGELRNLDLDDIKPLEDDELPTGAKSSGMIVAGAMVMTLAPVVIPAVIDFLKSWILRPRGETVEVTLQAAGGATIKVTGKDMSPDDVKEWISAFPAGQNHPQGSPPPPASVINISQIADANVRIGDIATGDIIKDNQFIIVQPGGVLTVNAA